MRWSLDRAGQQRADTLGAVFAQWAGPAWTPHGFRDDRLQCAARRLVAQAAIAFELVFVEELVGGGLVREFRMGFAVIQDVRVLVTDQGRLYIQQHTVAPEPV